MMRKNTGTSVMNIHFGHRMGFLIGLLLLASMLAFSQGSSNWRAFDANKDGRFDKSDLKLLLTQFGTVSTVDANNDGAINQADVLELMIIVSTWDRNADARVDDADFIPVTPLQIRVITTTQVRAIAEEVIRQAPQKDQIETQLKKEWLGLIINSEAARSRLYQQAATLAALRRQDGIALYTYAQAVLYNPQNTVASSGLGFFLGHRGRLQDALDVLVLARSIKASCEIHNNIGWVLARAGMKADAVVAYSQGAALCPTKKFLSNLGMAQLAANQPVAAAKNLINIPDLALSAVLNQSAESTQEHDTAWNEEQKQYKPTIGITSSYLLASARIDFYIQQILVQNTVKAVEQTKASLEAHIQNAERISQIMQVPHQNLFITAAQVCENRAHREKMQPIALELAKAEQAQFFRSGLESRRLLTYELGNRLLGAEAQFRNWVNQDLATIRRLEQNSTKIQELTEAVLLATQESLNYGRLVIQGAEASGRPITGLDNPMRYFLNPPVDYSLSEQEFKLKYFGGGTRPDDNSPIPCDLTPESTVATSLPVQYLARFLEFMGESLLNKEYALDTGLVGVSYTPSESDFQVRVGEGIFVEGTWNPKTGYGFNLGVGIGFKQSLGPIKLDIQGKAYINCKSTGENSVIYEAELSKPKELFSKPIDTKQLTATSSKSLWNPQLEIQISPASHEPILSIFDLAATW